MNKLLAAIFFVSLLPLQIISFGQATQEPTIVKNKIGNGDFVTISYVPVTSSAKGASKLEMYHNKVWRPGSGFITTIAVDADFKLGPDQRIIPKGTYALFVKPGKGKWEVMLSSNLNQLGSLTYDSTKTFSIIVTPTSIPFQQDLKFEINSQAKSVEMSWENTKISFPIN